MKFRILFLLSIASYASGMQNDTERSEDHPVRTTLSFSQQRLDSDAEKLMGDFFKIGYKIGLDRGLKGATLVAFITNYISFIEDFCENPKRTINNLIAFIKAHPYV